MLFAAAKTLSAFKNMHFAVAPCDMHETVVPFEFRSTLKEKKE